MPKTGLADITLIADKSGSMSPLTTDTIGGINQLIQEQKAVPGDANFTLVLFDTEYRFLYKGRPIQEVAPLTRLEYQASGFTALLDAVGRSITEVGARLAATPEHQRPEKVLFVIVTDGAENASKEYTAAQVKRMVEEQTHTWKWEFIYLGANVDAFTEAQQIGIAYAGTMSYDDTKVGATYTVASEKMAWSRSGGAEQSMRFTTEDREKLKKDRQDAPLWDATVTTTTTPK